MDDRSKGLGAGDDMAGRSSEDITARSMESRGDDNADADPQATRIRRDIEETREEMSETIDAIQEKLRPANLVSNATQQVKDAATERMRQMTQSAGDAANRMMYGSGGRSEGVVGGIRQNPIPAALIGIGAAWWYMNRRSEGRGGSSYRFDERYRGGEDYTDDAFRTVDDRRRDYERPAYAPYSRDRHGEENGFLDRVKNNPVPAALAGLGLGWLAMAGKSERDWGSSSYRGTTTYDAGEGGESSSVATGVAESAQQMAAGAQQYTREAMQRVRETGRRTQSQLERLSHENTLAVAAGALLLGAAVGLAIPETERENELLGETRDSMVERAQDMARNAASRAQDVAADLAGEAASRIVKGSGE